MLIANHDVRDVPSRPFVPVAILDGKVAVRARKWLQRMAARIMVQTLGSSYEGWYGAAPYGASADVG